MSKIVRTPNSAKGGLTPDEIERMESHTKFFIERAMRTAPIEPEKIFAAIKSLYAAADIKEPRVVIVPSPRVMALAGGFASAIWWLRKNPESPLALSAATEEVTDTATEEATRRATDAATDAATDDATEEATRWATLLATDAATDEATRQATLLATDAATDEATRQATYRATILATSLATEEATRLATDAATRLETYNATYAATYLATSLATEEATYLATRQATLAATRRGLKVMVNFYLKCASRWSSNYQGGNMWSSYDCYLTAARDILGLRLPSHEKYSAWEQCAIHGGFRWMHEEFCMVSDFPEIIKKDEQNRPHCDDGPSHRWRDGWEIYHIHGVHVTRQIVIDPHTLTIDQVRREENAEVRRVMIERMGWDKFCSMAQLKVIHTDTLTAHFPTLPVSETVYADMLACTSYRKGTEVAELMESEEFRDFNDRPLKFVRLTDPSTGERYVLRVWPEDETAYGAVAHTFGMTEDEYRNKVHSHS